MPKSFQEKWTIYLVHTYSKRVLNEDTNIFHDWELKFSFADKKKQTVFIAHEEISADFLPEIGAT